MIQNLVKKVKEKETLRIKNKIKDNIHAKLKRDKHMKKMEAEKRGDQSFSSQQNSFSSSEDTSSCCSEDKPEEIPELLLSSQADGETNPISLEASSEDRD